MQTPASKETYKKRAQATERPFARIKHVYGARSFLTRGLAKVRNEWRWLSLAFNLDRLMRMTPAIVTPVGSGSP
jgi:hypothetical protein